MPDPIPSPSLPGWRHELLADGQSQFIREKGNWAVCHHRYPKKGWFIQDSKGHTISATFDTAVRAMEAADLMIAQMASHTTPGVV